MDKLFNRVRILYGRFFALLSYLQSPFLLFVRVYWGWQLIESGWGKLHHLSNVTEYFTSLGLPMPAQMAVAISCVELFGGIFLALGLLSRLTALPPSGRLGHGPQSRILPQPADHCPIRFARWQSNLSTELRRRQPRSTF